MTHSLDLTDRALALRADPPTFRQVAAEFDFTIPAERINRWCAAGMKGMPDDDRYAPNPTGKDTRR
jgi:hypothetical protein